MNDSGYTFDEIADYLDRVDKSLNHKLQIEFCKHHMIALVIAFMVGFIISETLVAITQTSGNSSHIQQALTSTDSDGKNIVCFKVFNTNVNSRLA